MARPERGADRVRLRLDDPISVDDVMQTAMERVTASPAADRDRSSPEPSELPSSPRSSGEMSPAEVQRGTAEGGIRSVLRRHRIVIEWVLVLGGALVVALVVKAFLIQAFFIPSASMQPTLEVGDRVLVNRLSYQLHDVNRGDLIVFRRPGEGPEADDLIKRVVGLPGESIEIRAGRVYVDGAPLEEPYLADHDDESEYGPIRVPADHVFVLGDNRLSSSDSRSFGTVAVDAIAGRAFLRIWPPAGVGFL